MKKYLVMVVLLAATASVQAANMFWVGDYVNGNAAADWGTVDSWWDGGTDFHIPTAGDATFIQDVITGIPVSHQPVVSANFSATKPDFLFIGWNDGTAGTVAFTSGGHLETGLTRLGNGIGATGTLTMNDSWTYMNATTILEVGYNLVQNAGTPTNHLAASGNGLLEIGGNATFHASALAFGQESAHYGLSGTNGTANGTGQINMYGGGEGVGARLIVDGNLVAAEGGDGRAEAWIANGWLAAPNAGESIVATVDGGWTEFNVIPEPATLGMMTLLGGGMLWIRKRFMI